MPYSRACTEPGREVGKRRWGDKTPQYVNEIPTLHEIFPDARIIHIYRDGRDVALSWMGHPRGSGNLFAAANSWKRAVTTGRRDGMALPGGCYTEVSYEDLITNPAASLRRICDFIDEEYVDDVLMPTNFGKRSNPASAIEGTNLQKWKTAMSRADRVLFESIAGELLDALGYETEGNSRPVRVWERWWWRAHDAVVFLQRRVVLRSQLMWMLSELRLRWAELRHRLIRKAR